MHVEETLQTLVLRRPTMSDLNLKAEDLAHHSIMVNICIRLFCNPSVNEHDIDRTNIDRRTDSRTHTKQRKVKNVDPQQFIFCLTTKHNTLKHKPDTVPTNKFYFFIRPLTFCDLDLELYFVRDNSTMRTCVLTNIKIHQYL
jgi:hypothetical protein